MGTLAGSTVSGVTARKASSNSTAWVPVDGATTTKARSTAGSDRKSVTRGAIASAHAPIPTTAAGARVVVSDGDAAGRLGSGCRTESTGTLLATPDDLEIRVSGAASKRAGRVVGVCDRCLPIERPSASGAGGARCALSARGGGGDPWRTSSPSVSLAEGATRFPSRLCRSRTRSGQNACASGAGVRKPS